jgi:hypothetical protein
MAAAPEQGLLIGSERNDISHGGGFLNEVYKGIQINLSDLWCSGFVSEDMAVQCVFVSFAESSSVGFAA